jgi:hypothetical protein
MFKALNIMDLLDCWGARAFWEVPVSSRSCFSVPACRVVMRQVREEVPGDTFWFVYTGVNPNEDLANRTINKMVEVIMI